MPHNDASDNAVPNHYPDRQIAEQLSSRGEQHRVTLQDGLIRNVLGNHRLAQTTGADQNGIGGRRQKFQRHQFRNHTLIALLRPGPVKIGQRLETPNVSTAQPALLRLS